jgi:F-type H+-transporting ATPase subunit b
MLIEWFTVGAQALNFIVLVWLLKRFLYKPILHAVDAREKRIAKDLADASAKMAEAEKRRAEFEHKNAEFEGQRAALLAKATEEAAAERQRLLGEARKMADTQSAKRQEKLQTEARNLSLEIRHRTQQEVFAIARKALTDLASASLEERIAEMFVRRLRAIDGTAKTGLAETLKAALGPAVVRSAFDLPAEQRTAIQKAIDETFAGQFRLLFETAPDLIGGIELAANGQKVGWTISEYLESLESSVAELVKAKDKPHTKVTTKPREPEPDSKSPGPQSP